MMITVIARILYNNILLFIIFSMEILKKLKIIFLKKLNLPISSLNYQTSFKIIVKFNILKKAIGIKNHKNFSLVFLLS